jgi:catechol 2,3-dioxygenase-like lactoylglutathione lyase family enzyme
MECGVMAVEQRVECINPILTVSDMAQSLHFYVDLLGFEMAPWGDDTFTLVSRDGCGIYLSSDDQGQPGTWLWMGVEDARALRDDLVSKGVAIRKRLTNETWALEFQVEDPDGHVLRVGSGPE